MNEELKNRFDALSSTSDNEKLKWTSMGPAIQNAVASKKRKRRGLLWWFGGSAILLLTATVILYQNLVSRDIALTGAASTLEESISAKIAPESENSSVDFADNNIQLQSSKVEESKILDIEDSDFFDESAAKKKELRSTIDYSASAKTKNEGSLASVKVGKDRVETQDLLFAARQPKAQYELEERQGDQANKIGVFNNSNANLNTLRLNSDQYFKVSENDRVSDEISGSKSALKAQDLTLVLPKGEQEIAHVEIGLKDKDSVKPLPILTLEVFDEGPILNRASNFSISKQPSKKEATDIPKASPILHFAAFGGAQFGDAASAYKQAENYPGYTVGAGLEYELPSGWFGGLGFKVDQTNFSTQATLLDTVREYRPGQVGTIYTFSDNEFVIEYSDSIDVQYTRRVLHQNTQTDLVVPLHIGYRWTLGKWGVGLRGGVNALVRRHMEGRLLSASAEIIDVDQRSSILQITPQLGAELSYQLFDNWNVSVLGTGNQSFSVSNPAIEQSNSFWISQVQFGIKYRLL